MSGIHVSNATSGGMVSFDQQQGNSGVTATSIMGSMGIVGGIHDGIHTGGDQSVEVMGMMSIQGWYAFSVGNDCYVYHCRWETCISRYGPSGKTVSNGAVCEGIHPCMTRMCTFGMVSMFFNILTFLHHTMHMHIFIYLFIYLFLQCIAQCSSGTITFG
jgi:hypothetical protein